MNSEIKTLKDIININGEKFKNRTAFLEKSKVTKEFEKISYSKLKEDVNSLGTIFLEKLKLEGEKIAVIGENSYKWYVTYVATVSGVGVIVPLDKELPSNEIENLINRSEAKCIVYSSKKSKFIDEIRSNLRSDMIYIEMDKSNSDESSYSFDELLSEGKNIIANGNTNYLDKKIIEEDFSVLIFTSGTTAAPKGVMLSNKNLTTNIKACLKIVESAGVLRYFSILPMHHTYEFMITYLNPIARGDSIAICEGLKYIVKDMQETKPSVMVAVPLLVEKINKNINKKLKELNKEKLVKNLSKVTNFLNKVGIDVRRILFKSINETFGGNLKYIFCGAAPIDSSMVKQMEAYGFEFLQGYGLSETSPLVSATSLGKRDLTTVGKAVYGTKISLDLNENETVGEIMVKGDNVMLGYYKDEEKTKEVLKKGWFYTGDLGYFTKAGDLVIAGRIKNVIVTKNGKNIYPEEIEFLVNKIPLVSESLIYGKENETDDTDTTVAVKVTLDKEYIDETYGQNVPSMEELHDIIWNEIKELNRKLVTYKAIKHLEIKDGEFEKTTTMKIKRFKEISK